MRLFTSKTREARERGEEKGRMAGTRGRNEFSRKQSATRERELFISRSRKVGDDGPAMASARRRTKDAESASRRAAQGERGSGSKYGAKERESRLSVRTSESVYP